MITALILLAVVGVSVLLLLKPPTDSGDDW